MADYKFMYTNMFNAVTDAINILQKAQLETEEMFISQQETNITVLEQLNDGEEV